MKAAAALLVGLATLVAAPLVHAGGAEDEARRTFEEGLEAERNGQASACGKFRKALELIREVGPLKKVKECDVRDGKLLLARAKLEELIARWPVQDAELEGFKTELAAVRGRIAHVDLALAAGAPPGTKARIDSKPVDVPATSVELDPGEHEILVEVPSKPIERTTVTLGDGENKSLTIPLAEPRSTEGPTPPTPHPAEAKGGLGGLGIAGIVIAGVGVGAFVGAGVTGGLVLSKSDEFDACKKTSCPDLQALKSDGDTLLIANGVLFGVGIAGVGLGATLLVIDLATGPSDESSQSGLRPAPSAARLRVRPTGADFTVSF
jgi:hypothetical protein